MHHYEWDFVAGHKPCLASPEAQEAERLALQNGRHAHHTCVGMNRCGFYKMCDLAHKDPWEAPQLPQSVMMSPMPANELVAVTPNLRLVTHSAAA